MFGGENGARFDALMKVSLFAGTLYSMGDVFGRSRDFVVRGDSDGRVDFRPSDRVFWPYNGDG